MFDSSLGIRVIFTPESDKLVQVVWAKDGPIASQVIEVVHDDSDKQVENEEGANDEKRDEVNVGKICATSRWISCVFGFLVTQHAWVFFAAQHNFLPGFTRCRSEQHQQSLREGLEVVVSVDVGSFLRCNFSENLHANHAVDEEDQANENGNPRQGLEGFDESPQQGPDAFAFTEQFDQPHDTEQTEEVDRYHVPTRL